MKQKKTKVSVTFNGRDTKHIFDDGKVYGMTNGELIEILRNYLYVAGNNTVKVFINDEPAMSIDFKYIMTRDLDEYIKLSENGGLVEMDVKYLGNLEETEDTIRYANKIKWFMGYILTNDVYSSDWYRNK